MKYRLFILSVVILIATALRLWGIDYDLPYIYHPDEFGYLKISFGIFMFHDWNPHFFHYPSMMFYANSIIYMPYHMIGKLIGIFPLTGPDQYPVSLTMGVTKFSIPSMVLVSRCLTVAFGIGSVYISYKIGRRLFRNFWIGCIAALLLCVNPAAVISSRSMTPDTFGLFFVLLTAYFSIGIYKNGKLLDYILAGLFAGCAGSSKYNVSLIVTIVAAAHFLRTGKKGLLDGKIYVAAFLSILGFISVTPYALIDSKTFLLNFSMEAEHYSEGSFRWNQAGFYWYLNFLWKQLGLIFLLAALQTVFGIYRKSKATILLAAFPIVYFWFICNFALYNDRTILPIFPFIFLLGARFCFSTYRFLQNKASLRIIAISTVLICLLSSIGSMAFDSFSRISWLYAQDSRKEARIWIDSELDPGSKIGIEAYSPFVDPKKFNTLGTFFLSEKSFEWYLENKFDYLVFSKLAYGRYYNVPNGEANTETAKKYETLFKKLHLIRTFIDPDQEIRIYSTKPPKAIR